MLPVTYSLAGEAIVTAVDHKQKQVAGERLARVRWLRARPRAALTIDRYEEDWSQLAWVQALGQVTILNAADAAEELTALRSRYAAYAEQPPSGPILSLKPDRILWWRA